jgi:hypothetical protein
MLKFVLNRDKVVLDKNIILLEEFNNIVKYGIKKKNEELANSMLLYIFFCCDLTEDNPMRDVDFRQKPQQAKSRSFKDKAIKLSKEEEKLLDAGIDAYNFFNETSGERSEMALDKKIDEARVKLQETELEVIRNVNPTTMEVKFTSNESIITKIAEQIDSLMTLKLKMKQTALKIQNTSRVKGGKGSSMIERGTFKNLVNTSDE